jgi:hypothetical protein
VGGAVTAPVLAWIRRARTRAFVAAVVVVVLLALALAAATNAGHRVGPVRPAVPPVGGPDLPPSARPPG